MEHNPDLLVDVTDADILAAKIAWQSADDLGLDPARVAGLRASYRSLIQGQAQQIAERFRAEHARRSPRHDEGASAPGPPNE